MTAAAELADRLTDLLMLAHPPVAVSFRKGTPSADAEAVAMQPAGCCYWAPAQKGRLSTQPSDHANCSVGSYTHGLIDLEAAAAGDDTAAPRGTPRHMDLPTTGDAGRTFIAGVGCARRSKRRSGRAAHAEPA
jgi:hypothetical protein